MKLKLLITAIITVLIISTVSLAVSFKDVDFSNYPKTYQDAVELLKNKKAISGYPDGTFLPANTITRAEVVKVLTNALDLEITGTTLTLDYTDVKTTAWYAPYVASATRAGYIKGYEDKSFRPNSPVTYAELIAMILRIQKVEVPNPEEGQSWDEPYLLIASQRNLFKDYSTDDLKPNARARRDNTALIIFNAINYKPTEEVIPQKEETKPSGEENNQEIPKPTNTSINYCGVVGSMIEERGNEYVIVNCFDQGNVKIQIIKKGTTPTQKALIIFKVKSNGDITLRKELKISDINKGYLKIAEIDNELIAFEATKDVLDLSETTFMYNDNKINLNKLDWFFAEVELNDNDEFEFSNAKLTDYKSFSFEEQDRLFIDSDKKVCIILRGIKDIEE